MGHIINVDLRKGGGVAANFITGTIEVESTAMHTSGTALVLPDPVKVPITNGTAALDLEPSPAGEEPAWGYKVTIRSNSGRAWAEYVSVPAGAGPTAYTALERLTASPSAPPLTTWHQIVEELQTATQAAIDAAGLVGAPAGSAVLAAISEGGAARGELNAAIGEQTSEQVPPLVAAAIAADAAPAQAAAAAVDAALADKPVVPGRNVETEEWAIPFVDDEGYAAGGIRTDGSAEFVNLRHKDGSVPPDALSPEVGILSVEDTKWAIPFVDSAGYVAGGLRQDGVFEFASVEGITVSAEEMGNAYATLTKSSRIRVAALGDSLTHGFSNSVWWPEEDAWPYKMDQMTPATVINRGQSGQTIDELGIRFGALKLQCAVEGGQIPASGTVNVTIQSGVGWRPDRTWEFPGTLAGVPGKLHRTTTATTALTFERTTPGTAVPVTNPVTFASDEDVHRADTVVIFCGRNNVSYNVSGTDGSVVTHVVNGTKRMVDYLTPQVKQVLLVGTTTNTGETAGSSGHAIVTGINNSLAALYPGRFFDLREYLVEQAIHDLNITPTTADNTAMNGDTLPPSIMDDSTHYSPATATLVAEQIYAQLSSKGWID